MKKHVLAVVLVLLVVPSAVFAARLPRVVAGDVVTEVFDPQLAQDFIGQLEGQPEFFLLSLPVPEEVYISLRVEDTAQAATDISGSLVAQDGTILVELDGITTTWTPFTEKETGRRLLQGPATKVALQPGDYLFGVSSVKNDRSYVLAIGEDGAEAQSEVQSVLRRVQRTLMDIFSVDRWVAYVDRAGGPIVVGSVVASLFGLISIFFLWRIFRKH